MPRYIFFTFSCACVALKLKEIQYLYESQRIYSLFNWIYLLLTIVIFLILYSISWNTEKKKIYTELLVCASRLFFKYTQRTLRKSRVALNNTFHIIHSGKEIHKKHESSNRSTRMKKVSSGWSQRLTLSVISLTSDGLQENSKHQFNNW